MTDPPQRHRSAMRRTSLSRPIRTAIADGLIGPEKSLLDYGCGLGGDVRALREAGIAAIGWDPAHAPDAKRASSSIVNLGYVVNVIEDAEERRQTLRDAYGFAQELLIVSARLVDEAPATGGPRLADGVMTRIGTFQKFFEQHELRAWIDATLPGRSIAAAPGIFYVFADEKARAFHLVARQGRAQASRATLRPLPDRSALEPLLRFMGGHGRAPEPAELPELRAIGLAAGGVARAVMLASEHVGDLDAVRAARSDDLLVMLALARFDGRPGASAMPPTVLADARAFFGSYSAACAAADAELAALGRPGVIAEECRRAPFGKSMPTAHYVALGEVPSLSRRLRLLEGCARGYVGAVPGANVVKLGIDEPTVSYLSYEPLDEVAHPTLLSSVKVHLRELTVRSRRFDGRANPPILHRKELMLPENHPRRATYARLTAAEERHGLYANPSAIGTKRGWEEAMARAGVGITGHRLLTSRPGDRAKALKER